MRLRLCILGALAIAAAVAVSAASAKPKPAAAAFTFKTFNVPNAVYTDVLGINNQGVIVGQYMDDSNYVFHGFIASGSHITTVDVNGSVGTGIQSINDRGTAVGWSWNSDGSVHGFTRSSAGTIMAIDDPNAASDLGTAAYGINNSGVVAGYYLTYLNNGADCCGVYGFEYKNGTFSTISVTGEDDTLIYGINNSGAITGQTARHNDVSWHGFTGSARGAYTVFTGLGDNGEGTYPQAINDPGTVVGHSNNTMFVGWERLSSGQMVATSYPRAASAVPRPAASITQG